MFTNPNKDPGDTYDNVKWNLPTNNLERVYHNGYLYKLNKNRNSFGSAFSHKPQKNSLPKLTYIRSEIDRLCLSLYKQLVTDPNFIDRGDTDLVNGIFIFLDIHGPLDRSDDNRFNYVPRDFFKNRVTSKYLLSEIPIESSTGKLFNAINTPHQRFYDHSEVPLGRDKNMRSCYRDIFISTNLDNSELRDLIIHEISHTGCNHQTWIDDNHGADFKKFEKMLTKVANEIGFMR